MKPRPPLYAVKRPTLTPTRPTTKIIVAKPVRKSAVIIHLPVRGPAAPGRLRRVA